jgi:multisubunit Na+/H+ antiporter MnhB subunit
VLVSFVRLTTPVVLLLTGWFLVAGSSRPGGAFQAGAVLAGAALLLLLTGRKGLVPTGRWLRPAVVLGLAVFLAAAVLTRLVEGGWLDLPASWGVAVVLVVETALVVSIAAGLTVLVVLSRPRYVDAAASTESLGGAEPSDAPARQTEELT